MLFTLDWKSVVYVVALLEKTEEWSPSASAFTAGKESFRVSHDHNGVAGTRQQDVETLWGYHKANITFAVAATQASDDNIALFALVIV
jgi:hypothetical protein